MSDMEMQAREMNEADRSLGAGIRAYKALDMDRDFIEQRMEELLDEEFDEDNPPHVGGGPKK